MYVHLNDRVKEPFVKIPIYLAAVLLLAVSLATLRGAPSTESSGVDSPSGSRRQSSNT
jgi:hypothetical protein